MSVFSDEMNALINENADKAVIKIDDIANKLVGSASIDNVTIGELKMAYTKSRIAVAMYEKGYRSVIRGEGYYADPMKIERKEYAEKILQNGFLSVIQKEEALKLLKDGIKKNKNLPGQFEFDIDGSIHVSKSEAEILDALAKEAI